MESDAALWAAYRDTVGRFPDLDALRWRDSNGWHRATWRSLDQTDDGHDEVNAVIGYLGTLADDGPGAIGAGGAVSQREAFDDAVRLGAVLGVSPRDRVLGLGPARSGPWLRALWLGLVHGCAVHLGAEAVMSEVVPTIIIDEKAGT